MYSISVYIDSPGVSSVLASQNEENLMKAREVRNTYVEHLIEDGEQEIDYVPYEKEDLIFFTSNIIVELEEIEARDRLEVNTDILRGTVEGVIE